MGTNTTYMVTVGIGF